MRNGSSHGIDNNITPLLSLNLDPIEIQIFSVFSAPIRVGALHCKWNRWISLFSTKQLPNATLITTIIFFLWIFGNIWSLWDGSGSRFESYRHFFKHPQPL